MTADASTPDFPDEGTVSISWNTAMIDGQRRLGWKYESDPVLDRRLAITLLRDVASELEMDVQG